MSASGNDLVGDPRVFVWDSAGLKSVKKLWYLLQDGKFRETSLTRKVSPIILSRSLKRAERKKEFMYVVAVPWSSRKKFAHVESEKESAKKFLTFRVI